MSADWTTFRVVRQEDAGLSFRTEDALVIPLDKATHQEALHG